MCETCDYNRMLEQKGLRPTPKRLSVLSVLGETGHPLPAQEILDQARKAGVDMDRVTVYRTLKTLFKAGLAERVKAGGRGWYYHLAFGPQHPHHPHFYCTRCGKLSCLEPDLFKPELKRLAKSFPARIEHWQVSMEGICPDCLAG